MRPSSLATSSNSVLRLQPGTTNPSSASAESKASAEQCFDAAGSSPCATCTSAPSSPASSLRSTLNKVDSSSTLATSPYSRSSNLSLSSASLVSLPSALSYLSLVEAASPSPTPTSSCQLNLMASSTTNTNGSINIESSSSSLAPPSCASATPFSPHSDAQSNSTLSLTSSERIAAAAGCCIFLGDLPLVTTEQDLRGLFSQFGAVASVEIRRDRAASNALGYGFVTMESKDDAIRAKDQLSGKELHGHPLNMGWARKNTTLFVGDLDGETNTNDLRSFFRPYGPIVDEDSFVHACMRYGFVRFVSRSDAEHVKATVNGAMLGQRQIRLNWGDSNILKTTLHIHGTPVGVAHAPASEFLSVSSSPTATQSNDKVHAAPFFPTPTFISDKKLLTLLARFGVVVDFAMPFTMNALQHFAIVNFEESLLGEQSAAAALSTLNNAVIDGVKLTVAYGKKASSTYGLKSRVAKSPRSLQDDLPSPAALSPVVSAATTLASPYSGNGTRQPRRAQRSTSTSPIASISSTPRLLERASSSSSPRMPSSGQRSTSVDLAFPPVLHRLSSASSLKSSSPQAASRLTSVAQQPQHRSLHSQGFNQNHAWSPQQQALLRSDMMRAQLQTHDDAVSHNQHFSYQGFAPPPQPLITHPQIGPSLIPYPLVPDVVPSDVAPSFNHPNASFAGFPAYANANGFYHPMTMWPAYAPPIIYQNADFAFPNFAQNPFPSFQTTPFSLNHESGHFASTSNNLYPTTTVTAPLNFGGASSPSISPAANSVIPPDSSVRQ